MKKSITHSAALSMLLLLSACYATPGSDTPVSSDWNHMDYAAITCDPDKPPASCPPLHPAKAPITVAANTQAGVASAGNPNNNPVIPNNNANTRSDSDYNSVETHASESDVQHSANDNNLGFSAVENNHGSEGFNGVEGHSGH
jgi:hypothetical protein